MNNLKSEVAGKTDAVSKTPMGRKQERKRDNSINLKSKWMEAI